MKSFNLLKFTLLSMVISLGYVAFFDMTPCLGQEPGIQEKAAVAAEAAADTTNWQVLAKSPGVEIVSETTGDPGKVMVSDESPVEIAEEWLLDHGLEVGRNLKNGKLLYISVGSAIINARASDPAFIDSRYLAFQRAELQAKANTAIFLGVDLTTSRGSSDREINPKERAALEKIVNTSPTLKNNAQEAGVADDIFRLFKKTTRLAEAKLDQALEGSGVDVEQEKVKEEQKQTARQINLNKSGRLRNISEASLKAAACAMADVQGTQTIQTFEGSADGGYQVVVICLWSRNMQKLVDIMSRGASPGSVSLKKIKSEVTKQLPRDPQELACFSGVRAYINQHGEHVLLAFGQAGVEVIGGRRDKAFELAGKKARLRAMTAVRNFMGEKVAFKNVEQLREALALYAGQGEGDQGESEYRAISQFMENVQAQARRRKVTGLHGLKTYKLVHPFTDRPMVLKVMAWSPQSQALASEIHELIKTRPAAAAHKTPGRITPARRHEQNVPARKGIISSGQGADPDAF